jgi:hypothetical protein
LEKKVASDQSEIKFLKTASFACFSLYFDSPTNANIKGTAWGMFNALTERLDYFKSRKTDSENTLASASGFDAMQNAEKNKLFRAVKELSGVK